MQRNRVYVQPLPNSFIRRANVIPKSKSAFTARASSDPCLNVSPKVVYATVMAVVTSLHGQQRTILSALTPERISAYLRRGVCGDAGYLGLLCEFQTHKTRNRGQRRSRHQGFFTRSTFRGEQVVVTLSPELRKLSTDRRSRLELWRLTG